MNEAFIETTVLTNFLLKKDGSEIAATNAFSRYSKISIPQFAWKEFKRGPLSNYIWFHNKFVTTGSLSTALVALQRLSTTPQRYLTATAIQSMHSGFEILFSAMTLGRFTASHGPKADLSKAITDAMRLELKKLIYSSWKKRSELYGGPVQNLSCYPDENLKGTMDGRIDQRPRDCPNGTDCCLRLRAIAQKKAELEPLEKSFDSSSGRKELQERRKVVRKLRRHPSSFMSPMDCRRFGDAYFVLFCPLGATILTTNSRDINPMAAALGVTVQP